MTHESAEQIQAALDLVDGATIVADTSSLILAASENPGGTELGTVRGIEAIASRLGGRTMRQPVHQDRPNVSVRFGPNEPGLLFLGHSDVVPAGEGWTAGPFTPRVVDDRLVGRGATDMKGGLAAVLQAMAAVHAVRPDLPLELLVTVDEEDLATGILTHLTTPSRAYSACVVAEPTDLSTVVACRGAANIELTLHGRAAHAGRPSDGVSAINGAARVALAIAEDHAALVADATPPLGSGTWSVGRIDGGEATSIVPERCTLTVDRRLMPDESAQGVLDALLPRLHALPEVSSCALDASVLMSMPGFQTPDDHPLPNAMVAALAEEGVDSPVEAWTAACEGGYIAQHHGCPTIIMGPGDITGQAHQRDESVAIQDLETAARAYVRLALTLPA